jgi:hypothetical protein
LALLLIALLFHRTPSFSFSSFLTVKYCMYTRDLTAANAHFPRIPSENQTRRRVVAEGIKKCTIRELDFGYFTRAPIPHPSMLLLSRLCLISLSPGNHFVTSFWFPIHFPNRGTVPMFCGNKLYGLVTRSSCRPSWVSYCVRSMYCESFTSIG